MAKRAEKDLAGLIDEWAPQIEKTLNQLATKGPKLMEKGRKMAKSKGAKVPKKHVGQAAAGPLTKRLVVLGGLGALVFMAVRRALGGGADWQVDPVSPTAPADAVAVVGAADAASVVGRHAGPADGEAEVEA